MNATFVEASTKLRDSSISTLEQTINSSFVIFSDEITRILTVALEKCVYKWKMRLGSNIFSVACVKLRLQTNKTLKDTLKANMF